MNAPPPPPPPPAANQRIPQKHVLRSYYTPQQMDFHVYIDRALSVMCAPTSDSPQIARGRAQDVHRFIMGLGRYLNPVVHRRNPKRWLFQTQPIDVTDTLQKLLILKTHFSKYCCLKIPNDVPVYQAHCEVLHQHIDTAIRYIQKKNKTKSI